MVVSGWLLCITVFAAGSYSVFRISGKYNLEKQAVSYAVKMESVPRTEPAVKSKGENRNAEKIIHEEKNRVYNSGILAFLLIGTDQRIGTSQRTGSETGDNGEEQEGFENGRQADILFLLILDSHKEAMRLLSIDSSTMAEVAVYNGEGICTDTMLAPIGRQFGFGDGRQKSCEYQADAVQELLYGIPIHGYLAVDMDAVPGIRSLAAEAGTEKQKQFLTESVGKAKKLAKKGMMLPMEIYHAISGQIITDLTADELFYLATVAGGYHFDEGQIFTVPGENAAKRGEFYVDKDALYELVLYLFYEEAEE